MSLEKTHGRNYDLSRLLASVDSGEVVLPEFQRDFVWDSTAVKQLLATCLTGWPMGSLLLLPGRSKLFFRVRSLEDAPPIRQPYEMIVLDGQQRLTSLYQSLYGKGRYKYAVNLEVLQENGTIEDLEEAIVSVRSDTWRNTMPDPVSQLRRSLLPIDVLREAYLFYNWRDSALANLPVSEARQVRTRLTELYVEALSGIDRYEIPAVVIDSGVHPEAVARIFERVNRLGQPLGTFDLMVAKSYSTDFNLRERWDFVQQSVPSMAFLLGDGLPILSVIALTSKKSVRQQDVLSLSGVTIREFWERAYLAVQAAIDFLSTEVGVWHPDWLPYRVQLIVLAGLAFNGRLHKRKDSVISWFWQSTFQARFDVASNTRAVEDYSALSVGAEKVDKIEIDADIWMSVTKRQYGALHRGLQCLVARRGPYDPFDGMPLGESSLSAGVLPDLSFVSVFERSSEGSDHLLSLSMLCARGANGRRNGWVNLCTAVPKALGSQLMPVWNPTGGSHAALLAKRLDLIAMYLQDVSLAEVVVTDSSADSQMY